MCPLPCGFSARKPPQRFQENPRGCMRGGKVPPCIPRSSKKNSPSQISLETGMYCARYHSTCVFLSTPLCRAQSSPVLLRSLTEDLYSIALSRLQLGSDRFSGIALCRLAPTADSLENDDVNRLRHSFLLCDCPHFMRRAAFCQGVFAFFTNKLCGARPKCSLFVRKFAQARFPALKNNTGGFIMIHV